MPAEKKIELIHAGGKNTKAILLFHGMTGAPGELYHLAKKLHDAGFDVYCPIIPGHCQGTAAMKRVHWQDWYSFSIVEYDRLKEKYEVVHVGGICLGAVLALCVASERNSVKAVASLSTTLFLDGWSIPWFYFLIYLGLYTVLKYFYAWPEGGAMGVKNKEVRNKVQKAFDKEDTDYLDCFPIISVLEILRLSRVARKKFHKVTAPVLLMHSERDDITSVKSADTVYKKISSEFKEYIRLKNSYHLITLDNEKDFVFQKTAEFFLGA